MTIIILSCSQRELSFENLVERNDLTYEINNERPFSGKAFSKYENQQFREIGYFKDGKKVGVWEYFGDNGQIIKKETYNNNKLNGLSEKFSLEGKKIFSIEYKDNLKDGLCENYNENEIKISSKNFTKDTLNGSYKTYNEDGKILREYGNYKMGKKDGEWTKNLIKKEIKSNYLNGKLNGKFTVTNKDGVVTTSGNYKNGNQDGIWTDYYSNKTKRNESEFENRILKSKNEWDINNNLVFSAKYSGISTWYDVNGNKKAEGFFNEPNDLKISSLKIWLNGKLFDYNILRGYRWEWLGKG